MLGEKEEVFYKNYRDEILEQLQGIVDSGYGIGSSDVDTIIDNILSELYYSEGNKIENETVKAWLKSVIDNLDTDDLSDYVYDITVVSTKVELDD